MKLTLSITLFLFSFLSRGQEYTVYLSANRVPTDQLSAKYVRTLIRLDDTLFQFVDHAISDGSLSLRGTAKNKGSERGGTTRDRQIYHGKVESFYANGNLEFEGEYVDGDRKGRFTFWYENGVQKEIFDYVELADVEQDYLIIASYDSLGNQQVENGNGNYSRTGSPVDFEHGKVENGLKSGEWSGIFFKWYSFTECYDNGKLISGISRDISGKEYEYNQLETSAEYKGGIQNFYNYIGSKLNYPPKARRMRYEGAVYVQFVVDRDGRTTDVEVVKGIYGECDEQAKKAVESADHFLPGKLKGVAVRQRMVVPVIFKLQ